MDKKVENISSLLKEWENSRVQLEALFRDRDYESAKVLMEKGILMFIQFLSWSNELPATRDEPFNANKFEFKPVNVEERLGFIMSRPNLYHSYRQLLELMVEQEKLYSKRSILKKASKPKG
jgi:hypothetical protein